MKNVKISEKTSKPIKYKSYTNDNIPNTLPELDDFQLGTVIYDNDTQIVKFFF